MKKLGYVLNIMIAFIVAASIVWIFMPNTFILDGDYKLTKLGIIRPFHYIAIYYIIKLFLTRIGFIVHTSTKSLIGFGISIGLEIIFRLLAYVRSGQLVTKWWILGLVALVGAIICYAIDCVAYDVKFEDYVDEAD
ncbi:hypothetical protein [Clostridium tertium]|uniref:hypothetical protein n=1 Tax=Clostridium tertium TaxID=1559 RepID=UPI0023B2B7D6|nr:hypothetical protein [Clostridium tertium]